MDSSSKAVAHRATSDLHQQPGGTLMSALAPHAFVPSRRGHRRWPPGSCLAARGESAHSAPGWRALTLTLTWVSAARHGLEIRYELWKDAASGRIGRH